MKTSLQAILVLSLNFLYGNRANAQSYSIDWYKASGGGGTSAGSGYTVSGTIGQHDAGGTLAGGNYSVTGGFWSVYAVQVPGAPTLRIVLTSTNAAVVAWPSPSVGYALQSNTNLATTNWLDVSNTVSGVGGENQVIIPSAGGKQYFRLFHP
jgi:hypothetical protein